MAVTDLAAAQGLAAFMARAVAQIPVFRGTQVVIIRDVRENRPLDLAGQAHLLSSYSMSLARDPAPGNDPPPTYGKIVQS